MYLSTVRPTAIIGVNVCMSACRGFLVRHLLSSLVAQRDATVQWCLDGAHAQCREGYLQVVPPLQEEPAVVAQDLGTGGYRARMQACQEGPHPLAGELHRARSATGAACKPGLVYLPSSLGLEGSQCDSAPCPRCSPAVQHLVCFCLSGIFGAPFAMGAQPCTPVGV